MTGTNSTVIEKRDRSTNETFLKQESFSTFLNRMIHAKQDSKTYLVDTKK